MRDKEQYHDPMIEIVEIYKENIIITSLTTDDNWYEDSENPITSNWPT